MSVLRSEGHPRRWRGLSSAAALRLLRAVPMYVVLAAIMVLIIAPFFWMVSSAFKDQTAIYASPPEWIPSVPTTQNFIDAWNMVPFGWFLVNSLKVAGLITIGQLVTCSLAGYAFARLRFPGKEIIFGVYLSSLMVPSQVTIIPLFIVMRNLGLIDNHASLILPGLASAFGTFLLRQFFMTVPRELEEAAIIDGCGLLGVLWQVILPLSAPALAALAIFTFNGAWNDFFNPLIFLSSPQNLTLPAGLALLQGQFSATSPAVMLAGVCMAVLPVLVVFMLGQRYIVEGITMTGIKG
ncbi:MAG TPA: carbohydrate ABC transporter permease [Chloroflexota bacterium]|nr:carbohydrate ABC transporter permease [Chloroflexota bacterium]